MYLPPSEQDLVKLAQLNKEHKQSNQVAKPLRSIKLPEYMQKVNNNKLTNLEIGIFFTAVSLLIAAPLVIYQTFLDNSSDLNITSFFIFISIAYILRTNLKYAVKRSTDYSAITHLVVFLVCCLFFASLLFLIENSELFKFDFENIEAVLKTRIKAVNEWNAKVDDFFRETKFIKLLFCLVFGLVSCSMLTIATRNAFFSNIFSDKESFSYFQILTKGREVLNLVLLLLLVDPLLKDLLLVEEHYFQFIILGLVVIETCLSISLMRKNISLYYLQNYYEIEKMPVVNKQNLASLTVKINFVNERSWEILTSLFVSTFVPVLSCVGLILRSKCVSEVYFPVFNSNSSLQCHLNGQSRLVDMFNNIPGQCVTRKYLLESVFYVILLASVFVKGPLTLLYKYYLQSSKQKKIMIEI